MQEHQPWSSQGTAFEVGISYEEVVKVGKEAVQVLKDVSKCLTSLQTNVYMLHLISITLSSLHPFKLQEVATIPCQLPNSRTNLQCRYTSLPALLCGSWPQRLAGTFPPT